MIRHTVAFRWNDTVTDERIAAVGAALDALPDVIDAIAAYRHGPDLGVTDGNFDYAVVGDFHSVDDYLVYRDHPVHRQFIADHIVPTVAERAAVQFAL
jgi:hypothetical protein